MKHILIKPQNTTIITFNKGGSTLFTHTLKLFLNWKGIHIYDDCGKGKVVAITRNPINRFYSGFLHYMNWVSKKGYESNGWWNNEIVRGHLIESLTRFFEECRNGIWDNDLHYVRQGKVMEGMDIVNPILYPIESLHKTIEDVGLWRKASQNADFTSVTPLIDIHRFRAELPILTDLGIPLNEWDGQIFCGMYQTVLNNLKWGHHRGDSELLREKVEVDWSDLGREIREWVEEDSINLGYEKMI